MTQRLPEVPHHRQIPTTKRAIKEEAEWQGGNALYDLLRAMLSGRESGTYKNFVTVVATRYERISCLIYRNKDGEYVKPSDADYRKWVFEGFGEMPREIGDRVADLRGKNGVCLPQEAEHFFRLVWQVADLVCPMIACLNEQAFVHEYAYAIDYVIRHDGDLEKPVMYEIFPINYPDYEYDDKNVFSHEIREYEL